MSDAKIIDSHASLIEENEGLRAQLEYMAAELDDALALNSSLLAERDRLADELHDARGVCDLAIKHRDEAEAENAALKAALEEIGDYASGLTGDPTARLDRIHRAVRRALPRHDGKGAV